MFHLNNTFNVGSNNGVSVFYTREPNKSKSQPNTQSQPPARSNASAPPNTIAQNTDTLAAAGAAVGSSPVSNTSTQERTTTVASFNEGRKGIQTTNETLRKNKTLTVREMLDLESTAKGREQLKLKEAALTQFIVDPSSPDYPELLVDPGFTREADKAHSAFCAQLRKTKISPEDYETLKKETKKRKSDLETRRFNSSGYGDAYDVVQPHYKPQKTEDLRKERALLKREIDQAKAELKALKAARYTSIPAYVQHCKGSFMKRLRFMRDLSKQNRQDTKAVTSQLLQAKWNRDGGEVERLTGLEGYSMATSAERKGARDRLKEMGYDTHYNLVDYSKLFKEIV